jgi:hypothetical protein
MDAYGYGRGLSKLVGSRVSTSSRWRWRRIGSVMVVLLELSVCYAWMDFRPDELWNANYFMSERSLCCETLIQSNLWKIQSNFFHIIL